MVAAAFQFLQLPFHCPWVLAEVTALVARWGVITEVLRYGSVATAWKHKAKSSGHHFYPQKLHPSNAMSLDKNSSLVFSQRMSIPAGITGFNPWSRIQALFLTPCLKFLYLHLPICKKKISVISSAKPFQMFEICKRSR